jgi:hypothetical protein
MGSAAQRIVSQSEKSDAILCIATIFRAGASLSARIYKIYTLLSTGFVENTAHGRRRIVRKGPRGADFRGIAHRRWQGRQ